MINVTFIIWRESFEAVLIVGIIYSFLCRQNNKENALRYMWGGVGAGLGLSLLLAFAIHTAQSEMQGRAVEIFNIGVLVAAAALMAQMCVWMKHHAPTIKSELESGLRNELSHSRLFGVAGLTALAIAREGFEIVTFFYGMGIEAINSGQLLSLLAYAAAGVALTVLTTLSLNKGLKWFNRQIFFKVTTVFLLMTAGSLIAQASRKLIQMGAIPTLIDQVWDTSALLDERTDFGNFVSILTGYESTPAMITVALYGLFWAITGWFYLRD